MKIPESVPQAEIMLDKPRTIAFTFGAMRRIKQHTGKALDDEREQGVSDVLGTWIWAMLSEDDRKELSLENVWDCLHPGNVEEISAAFNALVGGEPSSSNGDETTAGKVELVAGP
jgi:hypothetical protein